MAFFKKFYFLVELKLYTLIFLWITGIANVLELIVYRYNIFEVEHGFWNVIGVSFYAVWTGCAVMFCTLGISGIHEFKPNFLKYCIRYLLCSAIFKAIFATLLFASFCNHNFCSAIVYASYEPLLLTFTDRFIKKLTPLSYIWFHVMAICYLMCGAFMVHLLGNKMLKRDLRTKESHVLENP